MSAGNRRRSHPEATAPTVVGSPLPDFSLPTLAGEPRSLSSMLAGHRGAVVVFWSAVCSHCRRYDAFLDGFGDRFPDLVLVVVAARENESRDGLRLAVAQRGLSFTLLHDAERRVAREWQVEQTPRAFLVDAERGLVYRGAIDNFRYPREAGYRPWLIDAATAFLAGRAPERAETASFGCPVESVYYRLPR